MLCGPSGTIPLGLPNVDNGTHGTKNLLLKNESINIILNIKAWKGEVIKKCIKKKGRVQHLPDSYFQTMLEWREPGEKIKCDFRQSMSTADESHSVG